MKRSTRLNTQPLSSSHPLLPVTNPAALSTTVGLVKACEFSPDGSRIVSASEDGTLKVWDAVTGADLLTLFGHTGEASACAFSPDGRFIVSGSYDETLKVWEAATGAEVHTLSGHTTMVNSCAFSPDGKWIVSASYDDTLKVWEMLSGQCILTYPVDGVLSGCAFHPDGEHLVACGAEGMYYLRLVQ
jgi:WD40 repeat protein